MFLIFAILDDVSSISGSDFESDDNDEDTPLKASGIPKPIRVESSTDSETESGERENNVRRHAKVFLRNKQGELLALHKCVVHNKNVSLAY